jgi:ribokinase
VAAPKPVVVIGSINMDLIARVPHVPAPGETILGRDFVMLPGGKGANQAVAAARLGAPVRMLGRVGSDELGRTLLGELRGSGVETSHVQVTPGVASGIAMITVGDDGENAITVASGANWAVTPDDVTVAADLLRDAAICVVQLELPLPVVERAVHRCRENRVPLILDPAPAPREPLPDPLWKVDILSPNETEAAALTGLPTNEAPARVAGALRERGARAVVLKLGARGAYVSSPDFEGAVAPFNVQAVDTTAAGDAFTGALAVALAEGRSLHDAVRFANAAGALACTKIGAQAAMPTRAALDELV